jgi:GT2 family glycosyltransferase
VFLGDCYLGSAAVDAPGADGKRRYKARFLLSGVSMVSGQNELSVRVYDRRLNKHTSFTAMVETRVPRGDVFRAVLDCPADRTTWEWFIEVSGWAFSSVAPVVWAEAFLGDIPLGPIPHALERRDVSAALPGAPARAGFRADFAIDDLDVEGEHPLTVRLYDSEGNAKVFTRTVSILRPNIRGAIGLPQPGAVCAGFIDISGWVFSLVSRIVSVDIFLDDVWIAQGVYGEQRPDVVASLKSAPLSCGFHHRLSLRNLDLDGERQLRVRVRDASLAELTLTRTITIRKQPGADIDRDTRAALEAAFAKFEDRFDSTPAVLDWDSGFNLKDIFPGRAVFSPPPGSEKALPYRSASVDIVVIPPDDEEKVAEARRVAIVAVARASSSAPVEWKDLADVSLPSASIIIPVYNNLSYTEDCLAQLFRTLPDDFAGEVLIVDDASLDETPAALERWKQSDSRIRVLRNETNAGFVRSCNRAAQSATGEYLIFLNNDTLPMPGWLAPLLRTFRSYPDAGAVGGKLIYPDGTLQEAGGVIFSDGSGCNFGKHGDAGAPLFNFVREVDYCSGALLAVRRDVFLRLGGFDLRYEPAYYEDTDLCFRLRECGYRVYYQPLSVVTHFEGATSGREISAGTKKYQAVNREKFVQRWARELERLPAPPLQYDFPTLYLLAQARRHVT